MHFEVLVEEPSARAALDGLLPKILTASHTFLVHEFQGKADLLKSILSRFRGYARRFVKDPSTTGWRIVVLVDCDRADCVKLKRRILQSAEQARLQDRVLVRIAMEELEAWFLGDPQALRAAYPKLPAHLEKRRGLRDPDAVSGGTWECLDRLLKQSSYKAGLQKIATAEQVAARMSPERNRSRSFQMFCAGIRKLVEG